MQPATGLGKPLGLLSRNIVDCGRIGLQIVQFDSRSSGALDGLPMVPADGPTG